MPDLKEARKQLQQLRDEFAKKLSKRIDEIESGLESLADTASGYNNLTAIYLNIHKLSGSAGTFGFQRITDQSHSIEVVLKEHLKDKTIPDAKAKKELLHEVEKLRHLVEVGPDKKLEVLKTDSRLMATAFETNQDQHIYIVEDDVSQGQEISAQLSYFGYGITLFIDATQAADAIKSKRPDFLILDMMLPEGDLAGADLAKTLTNTSTEPLPIIFISSRTDWESRLAAVRAGAVAYIDKPVDFTLLLDQLDKLARTEQQKPFRVLILDDDVDLTNHYSLILRQAGMDVKSMNQPNEILTLLDSFNPELIIMDLYLEEITGAEVAQVIRQHKTYFSLPIIFLSIESNVDVQMRTLEQGDDFLQKPISDRHLISTVKTKIERARILGKLMYHDSLTGLLNHITLKLHLETELARCRRLGKELCYVMIDLDGFKQANDKFGHQVGDKVLKSLARLLTDRLRQTDQLGRYGGDEFGVILPDTSLAKAFEIIEEIRICFFQLQHLSKSELFFLSISVGIASSRDCDQLDALISAADEALYQAKHNRRNNVSVYSPKKKQ